jgi:hypothetical protein
VRLVLTVSAIPELVDRHDGAGGRLRHALRGALLGAPRAPTS